MAPTRTEKDSLGTREIPEDVYYGIQTDRAVENFPISGLRAHARFIDAYIHVKKAAALANARAGLLEKKLADAIVASCDEVLAGKLRDQFPVDVFSMGAGTAIHMNVNEVLANRANERLGSPKGSYKPVHPNDHVNMGQSTNDTFPTVVRVAGLLILKEELHAPLEALEKSFARKAKEFDGILKSARTHLQDAVPVRLGQEFAAYAECLRKCRSSLQEAEKSLTELGLGGSAAGTGLNTAPGYREQAISELAKLTGLPLIPARDMREAMQSQRPIAEVSASLRNLCLELTRILNDLRLLDSGPTTGFSEINLPAIAPGSSIMPGKVNPSVLEMANMVAFQVIGADSVIALAVQAGQLELNVMTPVMAYNLNFAASILGHALKVLKEKCVDGITANADRCRHYAEASMGLATALNAYIGYAQAAEVCKDAEKTGKTIVQVIRDKKILTEDQIRKIMDPVKMTEPGIPERNEMLAEKTGNAFQEGLEGVIAAESSICLIDGKNSKLMYRGYDIHELAAHSNFEETAHLLLVGKLPTAKELDAFRAEVAAERGLPGDVVKLLASFPKDAHPMAVLRSAVSMLAFYDKETEDRSPDANRRKAIRLIAKTPTMVAAFERLRKDRSVIEPKRDAAWSGAKNFLYMMKGREGTEVEDRMLDKYLILLAEHDLNASTFAARITASTTSDIYSAIASAVGTLKGDLHGSANTRTMESLLAIKEVSRVEAFVDETLRAGRKIMGFGHRVYKGPDPRAKDLHEMAKALAEANAEQAKWYAISEKLEKVVWDRKKLNCNVDFYSASVLYTIGVPVDLFTPLFAMSRMAGWTSHVLEQHSNNRLIRPVSHYTGAPERPYVPVDRR